MPKPAASIYFTTVTFNGVTYDRVAGGPQGINVEYGGQNIPFRSGDDIFPVFNPIVDKDVSITIELSEFYETIISGTKSDLAVSIEKPDGNVLQFTFQNMVFVGSTANQPRAGYATRTLKFVFEGPGGNQGPQGTVGNQYYR
jgi:hypothetical protein